MTCWKSAGSIANRGLPLKTSEIGCTESADRWLAIHAVPSGMAEEGPKSVMSSDVPLRASDAWLARTSASWEAFEIAAVKDAEIQSCPVFISKRGFED